MELASDGMMCNLKSLILMGQNCDNWVRKLTLLIFIDMGTTEGVFNINT